MIPVRYPGFKTRKPNVLSSGAIYKDLLMSHILPVETFITVCFEWFYCFDWGERIAYEHTGRFTLQKSNALPNWDMLLAHDLNKNLRQ